MSEKVINDFSYNPFLQGNFVFSFAHTHPQNFLYYEVHTISFQTFFVWAFKIDVDSWKFSMLLQYILWYGRPIFMISAFNEQLQQELDYTLTKAWLSQLVNFKNAIWTWGYFRRTICNKILF